jgi:uncharacterized cupin superfamily protein
MIAVVPGGSSFTWSELPRPPGDTAPPGRETILHRSNDRKFSCGFWKRVPEAGALDPPFDEIMMILEGDIEITRADGTRLRIRPGDVLAAPNGTVSRWHSFSPVYKFWAVHHGEVADTTVTALLGNEFDGGEAVAFSTPSASFRAGLRACEGCEREFTPDRAEVALVLAGSVELQTDEAPPERAATGDVILAPEGSAGRWRARGPTRMFWATYRPEESRGRGQKGG